jgi:hypothetical protein
VNLATARKNKALYYAIDGQRFAQDRELRRKVSDEFTEGTIARCIAVATKPLCGRKPGLIRP